MAFHIRSIGALATSLVVLQPALAQVPLAKAPPAPAPPRTAPPAPLTRALYIATMDGEYRKLDSNRDGKVTKAEIDTKLQRDALAIAAQRARGLFARIDSDRNGQISIDEFVKANSVQIRPIDGSATMNRLDTNRDQKVTLVEYRILTLAGFDRLDSDRDGVITAAEQRAAGVAK